ncbi:1,4-dihydroxy-2-naphthoate octaprenyltransferase [Candidatus Bathyarchaeota archaeon]|nr:1,4-dihydroxy-2-naphthoate octaprenyltransferase [Candidatus Bathyarchaeota archaeon]
MTVQAFSQRSLTAWIRLARIPFLTATIIPTVLGAVIAWDLHKSFHLGRFILTLIGAVCLHIGTNIINDYFDFQSGCDVINVDGFPPITGGSHVLVEGLIKPRSAYIAALSLFSIAAVIGVILSIIVGWIIIVLGLIGVISGYFYVKHFAAHGLGEFAVGLNFGPLMVFGSYYVQAQNISFTPFIASVPVGLLVTAVLWINEIPDYEADKKVNKKTLVVRVGRRCAADLYGIIVISAYTWILMMVMLGQMPPASISTFVTLPLAIKAITIARKYYDKPRVMIAANLSTVKTHLLFGLLMIAGYVIKYFYPLALITPESLICRLFDR